MSDDEGNARVSGNFRIQHETNPKTPSRPTMIGRDTITDKLERKFDLVETPMTELTK
jgi:hypothetical protein